MPIKVIAWLLLIYPSALLYRMGGSGRFPSATRDAGCSFLATVLIGIWGGWHWTLILTFGLGWGALTTYWDKLTRFWRKNESEYFENWFLHGFFTAFAAFPFAIAHHDLWLGVFVRSVATGLLMAIWSVSVGKDTLEEKGRGGILLACTPLIFWF